MSDERDTPDDLYPFAQMLVKQLLKQYRLRWNEHKIEDATQDLFLAGWQVWRNEQDVGLAKNRMRDRTKNLLRDDAAERKHEPKTHLFPKRDHISDTGKLWSEDATRAWDAPDARASIRGDPAEAAAVNEYLERLPDRLRRVLLLRMAGCTNREIADELGLSLRTVDREFETIRKEHPYDDAE